MASKNLSRESQLSITQYVPAAAASRSSLVTGAAPFLYKTASITALPPMILQKTGWRIKQLISHRRSRTFDDEEISTAEKERRLGGKPSRRPSKRRSWISNGKTSVDVPFLENSNGTSQRQKDVTAHSSSSSLCSCDCETNNDRPHSLFSEPASPKILYLQPSADLSGDAKIWRLIFPDELESPPPAKSTFDLLEALALEPTDDEKTPTPTIKNTRGSSENQTNPEVFDEVVQLIREADEAFKDISTAFMPDASEPAVANEDDKEESPQTVSELERHVLKKQRKVPITRSNSISKAKRTKSTKKRARLLDLTTSRSTISPINSSSPQNQRWTLVDVTDNISDIFSGRMFGKMEVNEMIDTTRIGRIPHNHSKARIRESKHDSERKGSIDTISSHGTDELPITPKDPFSLESFSSCLGASGIVPTPPDPGSPPLSGSSDVPVIPLKSELRKSKRDSAIYVGNGINILPHLGSKDISMPFGPSLRQRSRSYPKQPSLPTIQEISTISSLASTSKSKSIPSLRKPNNAVVSQSSSYDLSLPSSIPDPETQPPGSVDKHILLNSTPFTLTSPNFKHGSIRLLRSRKRSFKSTNSSSPSDNSSLPEAANASSNNTNNSNDPGGAESGLDWTAFEMAISGGTGNYLMEGRDPEAEEEGNVEEIEEIVEWWKEFGFEGVGSLVDGKSAGHRRKKSRLRGKDVGISYEMDACTHATSVNIDNEDKYVKVKGKERDKELAFGEKVLRGDQDSLPPSPMDDVAKSVGLSLRLGEGLEKGREVGGKEVEDVVVPMGFNLSHDLDDYLKWEVSQSSEGILLEN